MDERVMDQSGCFQFVGHQQCYCLQLGKGFEQCAVRGSGIFDG